MDTGDMIAQLTRGRPYVFVIMAYDSKWALYERIERVTKEAFGVECIRADHVKAAGRDLLARIHLLIERAELIIAEISIESPNVFYEIGYAVAARKRPILLIEKGKEAPTDLKGLEVMEYDEGRQGIALLESELTEHIRQQMNWEISLLRDMLQAPRPEPAYIVASPKYPPIRPPEGQATDAYGIGQRHDERTFGDNLGILGLISAFGLMMGEGRGVELISARYCPDDLAQRHLNLYLIGSRKVNPLAGKLLAQLQENQDVKWSLDPYEGHTEEEENWRVCLYRTIAREKQAIPGTITPGLTQYRISLWTEDYGIVMRAPHPQYPDDRLVLIMAGAHTLGTGAACLAATRSPLIRQIKTALPEGVLEDKRRAFWVLVKGTANPDDYLLDVEGVTIEEAGVYE